VTLEPDLASPLMVLLNWKKLSEMKDMLEGLFQSIRYHSSIFRVFDFDQTSLSLLA
jgi:hypothetical protein